jgi:hypothetical protein
MTVIKEFGYEDKSVTIKTTVDRQVDDEGVPFLRYTRVIDGKLVKFDDYEDDTFDVIDGICSLRNEIFKSMAIAMSNAWNEE